MAGNAQQSFSVNLLSKDISEEEEFIIKNAAMSLYTGGADTVSKQLDILPDTDYCLSTHPDPHSRGVVLYRYGDLSRNTKEGTT